MALEIEARWPSDVPAGTSTEEMLRMLFVYGDRLPESKVPGADKLIAVTLRGADPDTIPDEPDSGWKYVDGRPTAVVSEEYAAALKSLLEQTDREAFDSQV